MQPAMQPLAGVPGFPPWLPAPPYTRRAPPPHRGYEASDSRPPSSARVRSAPGPARRRGRWTASPSQPASQKLNPFAGRFGRECGRHKTLTDAAVPLQVGGCQGGVRVVPDLGRQLMPPDIVFEFLLVLRAIRHQPACGGVSDAVTENHVQSEEYFVDEIVHITVQAAIVVTGKVDALLIVQKEPLGKVNGAHASQPAPGEYMPGGPVDH